MTNVTLATFQNEQRILELRKYFCNLFLIQYERFLRNLSTTLSAESHLVLTKGHAFDVSISALYLTHVSVEEMAYVGPTLSESSMSKAFKVAQS